MPETNKSNFLDDMFKRAVQKANEADMDEPFLVWPELPKDEAPEE